MNIYFTLPQIKEETKVAISISEIVPAPKRKDKGERRKEEGRNRRKKREKWNFDNIRDLTVEVSSD